MSRILKRATQVVAVVSGMVVVSLFFQNCGQPGSISTQVQEGFDYDDNGTLVQKQQVEKTLSSADAPPLKIVFVMDNSNSMTLNNLNLQQSISSMFDNQANNLSQFNAEMYFLTTAQLPSLSGSFAGQLKSPSSLVGSAAQIENNYRNPFNGLIAGDLLGFDIQTTTTPNLILKEYKAQPVVSFQDTAQGTIAVPSIKYVKGSSIDALKAEVAARLSVLAPAKASQISDAAVFPALDTESGLCAMGRILRYPDNYIKPGDVTSFVVVSDENEADITGAKCLGSESREFLYKVACVQRIPASVKKETQINYQTLPGAGTKQTVFTVTPPDLVRPKVDSTLTLNRAAKNATCSGTQDREFTVNYQIVSKTYVIKYSKKPKLGEREGGVPIYGAEQLNLVTGNQSGMVPADCANNISRLRTILSDSTSQLTIMSCAQNADTNVNQPAVNLTYAAYPSVDLGSSTMCSTAILGAINQGGALVIANCSLSRRTENIPAASLTAKGFTTSSDQATCQAAVASVCANSSNALRSCTYTSFGAQVTADTKKSNTITQNTALNCNSACSNFPGFCATDSTTQSVSNYATSMGYTCSAATANSTTQTYTTAQSSRNVTIPGVFSCDNKCQEVPGACSGMTTAVDVKQYNLACSAVVQDVPGAAAQNKVLAKVVDQNSKITCDTLCTDSGGICMAANLTIGQHITNNLMGQNCSAQVITTNIAEVVNRKDITRVKQSALATTSCDAGYDKEGNPTLTSDYEDSTTNISGSQTLPDYILSRMRTVIGAQAATLSAFITPAAAVTANSPTSYGQAYEQLVTTWGKGSVQDIRSPSYAPALTQLSQVLRSQLLRSVNFPEVKVTQRIRKVWKKAKKDSDWGVPLSASDWSATGGTVTLAAGVVLDVDDQIKIEFY